MWWSNSYMFSLRWSIQAESNEIPHATPAQHRSYGHHRVTRDRTLFVKCTFQQMPSTYVIVEYPLSDPIAISKQSVFQIPLCPCYFRFHHFQIPLYHTLSCHWKRCDFFPFSKAIDGNLATTSTYLQPLCWAPVTIYFQQ